MINFSMTKFEEFLKHNLPEYESFHPHYNDSLSKMFFAGGKRFRPALLLGVVEAYSPLLLDGSMHIALALESLHTYSLIHDDLPDMDNADLRRNTQTIHKQYNNATAILAGDALNTYAFELIANAPLSAEVRIALVKSLSQNGGAGGMVLGQAIDCYFENEVLNLEQVKILHKNKTGKLIACSLEMGAIIVGRKDLAKSLYNFGLDLGLLFQVQDDILDITQTEKDSGKSTAKDEKKNSFIRLMGLKKSIEYANTLSLKLQKEINQFDLELKESLHKLLEQYINRHKEF